MTKIAIEGDLDTMPAATRASLAALFGGTALNTPAASSPATGTPASTTPAASITPVAAVPATVDYFPADAGNAPFPSPENSRMIRNPDGTLGGRPYLITASGTIYRMVTITGDNPAGFTINGKAVIGHGAYNLLIVRTGDVFLQLDGGQWQHFEPSMGSIYNSSLPDATSTVVTPTAGAASDAPAASPTLPTPSAVAPGSTGTVATAAPGGVAAAITALVAGGTLELDGHYAETFPAIGVPAKLRLKPGTVLDFTTQALAHGLGGVVPMADFILEGPAMTEAPAVIMGAGINEGGAGGTGGLRPGASCNVTVTGNVVFRGNQNGISGGGFPLSFTLVDTTLEDNGLGDGGTHNIYVSTGTVLLDMTQVTSRKPRGGHTVKARTMMFAARDCDLSGAETLIDLPNGTVTVATVSNTKLTKDDGAANHRLFGYGEEGATIGRAGMTITGGTVTGGDTPFVMGVGTVTFDGTVIVGTKPTGQGVTLKGL